MATLTTQDVPVTGKTITMGAAAGGGDKVPPGCVLVVRNGDASPKTVTIVVPGNTEFGVADPDFTFSVAAGALAMFGPLPSTLADPDTRLIDITYSAVTSVTVAAVTV